MSYDPYQGAVDPTFRVVVVLRRSSTWLAHFRGSTRSSNSKATGATFIIVFWPWPAIFLTERLPDLYEVRLEEWVTLEQAPGSPQRSIRPDVSLIREPRSSYKDSPEVAVLEPPAVLVPLPDVEYVEVPQVRLEIYRHPGRELITVLELLSPTNKTGAGREDYAEKRRQFLKRPVHLVEIDFLVGGQRLEMGAPLPPGDFHTFVARAGRRPECEVRSWGMRDPLPSLAIPLAGTDPDLIFDVSRLYETTYERARYARWIDHEASLSLPFNDSDPDWAENLARRFSETKAGRYQAIP